MALSRNPYTFRGFISFLKCNKRKAKELTLVWLPSPRQKKQIKYFLLQHSQSCCQWLFINAIKQRMTCNGHQILILTGISASFREPQTGIMAQIPITKANIYGITLCSFQ